MNVGIRALLVTIVGATATLGYNNCGEQFKAFDPNSATNFSVKPAECRKITDQVSLQGNSGVFSVLEGVFKKTVIDFDNGQHRTDYTMETSQGEIWQLLVDNNRDLEEVPVNSTVRVLGAVLEKDDKKFLVTSVENPVAPFELMNRAQFVPKSGNKTYLAVRVAFNNGSACTQSQVGGNFNRIQKYYKETSHNALNIDVANSVITEVSIDFPKLSDGDCYNNSRGSWRSAVVSALQAKGINHNSFDYAYFYYNINGCRQNFNGQVGVIGGWAEINGHNSAMFHCANDMVLAHETGHLLSLGHAGIGRRTYADGSCVMGNNGVFRLNSPHKEMLGWLPEDKIITVDKPRTYRLASLGTNHASTEYPQVLKIRLPGMSTPLYAAYRSGTHSYSSFSNTYKNKLNFHKVVPGSVLRSLRPGPQGKS